MANQNQGGGTTQPPGIPILHGPKSEEIAERERREEAESEQRREQAARDERQVQASEAQLQIAKQQSLTNSRMALFTFILMLLSAAGTVVAVINANAAMSAANTAEATLKDMKTSGDETKRQVDRLIAQQQRTADAMEGNLRRSKKALDASIRISRTDQRAWIGVTQVNAEFVTDKVLSATVELKNSGKTPALETRSAALSIWGPRGTVATIEPSKDASEAAAPLPPNGIRLAKLTSTVPLTQYQVDSFLDGSYEHVVVGTIWYSDVFGQKHITKYCFKLNTKSKSYDACASHNEAN